jgi:hypothetical protein
MSAGKTDGKNVTQNVVAMPEIFCTAQIRACTRMDHEQKAKGTAPRCPGVTLIRSVFSVRRDNLAAADSALGRIGPGAFKAGGKSWTAFQYGIPKHLEDKFISRAPLHDDRYISIPAWRVYCLVMTKMRDVGASVAGNLDLHLGGPTPGLVDVRVFPCAIA